MTLVKTIHQWNIDTEENLASFERESLEVLQKVDRPIYHRFLLTDPDFLPDPNDGDIIGKWNHEFEGPCYLVEDENGKVHMDYQPYQECNR